MFTEIGSKMSICVKALKSFFILRSLEKMFTINKLNIFVLHVENLKFLCRNKPLAVWSRDVHSLGLLGK